MKILELPLGDGHCPGMKPSTMTSLTDLVVLAGPNGAGKSRILSAVHQLLSDGALNDHGFKGVQHAIERHDRRKRVREQKRIETLRQLKALRENLKIEGPFEADRVLEFFPKIAALFDYRSMPEAQQKAAAREVLDLGLDGLDGRALAYVARIERARFAATHQDLDVDAAAAATAIAEQARLAELIEELLGSKVKLDVDQQILLFGKPIADAALSPGQKLLLQMAVALHAQGSKVNGLVLLLDEPECHLHPDVVIDVIGRLRALNKLGQIWIATHCVPLLAAVPTECIWYVNQGEVKWAGRQPEIVLEGLLGGPEGRERMSDFLRLPAQFAANRFAAECLVAPSAVSTGADDPQARQLRKFCEVEAGSRDIEALRVLDFGAGHGRLLLAMREMWGIAKRFDTAVDYFAFEPDVDNSSQLLDVMTSVYTDPAQRVFTRLDQLANADAGSMDVVVLCNVLHEISPEKWRHLLGQQGDITRLLKPKGHLLVLEDMEIPHGEKAHRFGFLLLESPHLHKLLKCNQQEALQMQTELARGGRLTAHAIPASLLGRTDRDSAVAALTLLRKTAIDNVTELRQRSPSSRNGRLHALWTQQLANAVLGLESI